MSQIRGARPCVEECQPRPFTRAGEKYPLRTRSAALLAAAADPFLDAHLTPAWSSRPRLFEAATGCILRWRFLAWQILAESSKATSGRPQCRILDYEDR